MSDSPSREDFADAAAELDLPHPGLVEKDYYVVRALQALRAVDAEGCHLVFGGGTSLCRAHRIIDRMSEDIDLRIAPIKLGEGARKRFRNEVTQALQACGFGFDPETDLKTGDSHRYSMYKLRYDRLCDEVGSLRPEVKVEVSSWPLLQEPETCSISSFWAQANGLQPELADMPCVTVTETCADKFVALTRRIGEERHQGDARDATVLRHAYDLACAQRAFSHDALMPLVLQIMESDRESRGRKFEAYREDPVAVSRASIQALMEDPVYAEGFAAFVRDMVYGKKLALSDCMAVLHDIAGRL